ncbi:MAG: hypothetical protein N2Z20_01395, partial [Elusimicrobiales bacterium]|nr:hypothetical protein [Elusimicrobiales bacterium]
LGKKNRKIFNCPDLFYFIRGMIHPRISLIVIRDEKLFKQIKEVKRSVFTKIMLKIKQNVGNWKELNFYISDNEIIDKDVEKFEIMKTKLQKIGIKTITLSQLIKNPTIETILKEMKKYKMRAIIVSIDDKLPKNMMLKELTTNVLKNLKRKSKITTRIQTVVVDSPLTNSFQTIVVSTPLSKEFTLKKYKSMIYNINMKKRGNYVP